jgi:hypothetical protein
MTVDVLTETVIDRPVREVASFAADPLNATKWYKNIKSSRLLTPPPVRVGSQVVFVAQFLGRRLEYTYELTEYVPGKVLRMRTSEGPFAMETTYTWEAATPDSTRMTLRNRGEPQGFSKIMAPMMSSAMRRANTKDLQRLKTLLEAGTVAVTA